MIVKYYIRLDDAHENMHIGNWKNVERILCKYGVKPIVGVIPDNKDKTICYDSNSFDLWNQVKIWDGLKWHIGMHGYQHILNKSEYGIFPINMRSEFVGLTYSQQKLKIKKGIDKFTKNGISPTIFIAPAHGLDLTTLKAIKSTSSIRIISDGFYLCPTKNNDFIMFPQQLWGFRRMPFGVWTICLHPSSMTEKDLSQLDKFLSVNSELFPDFLDTRGCYFKSVNAFFKFAFTIIYKIKHWIK